MGVFALFRRKSKEEASGTETVTEEAEAAADVSEVLAASEAGDPAVEAAGAAPAEVVEIPKQQSAEEAADREAGESARS